MMPEYFANFRKTGVPNWPAVKPDGPAVFLRIDVETQAQPSSTRAGTYCSSAWRVSSFAARPTRRVLVPKAPADSVAKPLSRHRTIPR
jgi:hypothetical protein